jgi:hypothetical protein
MAACSKIAFHLLDDCLVAAEVIRRNRAMGGLAIEAIVPGRNIGGDEYAVGGRKRAFVMQQNLGKVG